MSDDDKTPTYGKHRGQWDRRAALSDSERARRVHGVPVVQPRSDDEEVTSPIDLLDREPNDQVREVVRRSKRVSGAPATVEDIVALKLSWERSKERDNSAARKVLAMLPSPEEIKQLRADMTSIRIASVILKAAVVIAVGVIGYVVDKEFARTALLGKLEIRMNHVEDAVKYQRDRDDRIQPRLPTQKDSSP